MAKDHESMQVTHHRSGHPNALSAVNFKSDQQGRSVSILTSMIETTEVGIELATALRTQLPIEVKFSTQVVQNYKIFGVLRCEMHQRQSETPESIYSEYLIDRRVIYKIWEGYERRRALFLI